MSADDGPEARRLPPVSRRREREHEPFNPRPAVASLGEAPDWRGYPPPGVVGGEGVNAEQPSEPGDLLMDLRTGGLGRVDRLLDDYVWLRLRGGGRPWVSPLPACRPLTDDERRTAVRRAGPVLAWLRPTQEGRAR